MERDEVTSVLEDVGAVVLANACGPCIGQVSESRLKEMCALEMTLFLRSGSVRITRARRTVSTQAMKQT